MAPFFQQARQGFKWSKRASGFDTPRACGAALDASATDFGHRRGRARLSALASLRKLAQTRTSLAKRAGAGSVS